MNNLDIAASRALMARLQNLVNRQGRSDHRAESGTGGVRRAPAKTVTEGLLHDVFGTGAQVGWIDGRPVVLV